MESIIYYYRANEFFCEDPILAIYFGYEFCWIVFTIVGDVFSKDIGCYSNGFAIIYQINCNITWIMLIIMFFVFFCSINILYLAMCCCCFTGKTGIYEFFVSEAFLNEAVSLNYFLACFIYYITSC